MPTPDEFNSLAPETVEDPFAFYAALRELARSTIAARLLDGPVEHIGSDSWRFQSGSDRSLRRIGCGGTARPQQPETELSVRQGPVRQEAILPMKLCYVSTSP